MSEGTKKSRTIKADRIKVEPRNRVEYSRRHGILLNGKDNAYPTRMERLTYASSTAKQAARAMAKFIRGRGFSAADLSGVYVGKKDGRKITALQLLAHAANSLSIHRGFFWHIGYNAALERTSVSPIPFRFCRFGKPDSSKFSGKIRVYDNWDLEKSKTTKKGDIRTYDVYNPDPEVVRSQIEAAGGIENYAGQVYWFFMDQEFTYPLATIDDSQDDAAAENQLGVFKREMTFNGFLADWIILQHAPFENEADKDNFKTKVHDTKGAQSAGNILLLEDVFDQVTPHGNVKVNVVKTALNTRLFESWQSSCSNQVRRSFNNIPKVLIDEVPGKLGATSAEAMQQARELFSEQTREERDAVSAAFAEVFGNFYPAINPSQNWEIEPLYTGSKPAE